MSERRNDIRCICGRKPLLATFGRGGDGKLFIHVKVYKQSRIYGEVWVSADAEVKIRCRECLRVQKIKIVSDRPLLEEEREMMDAMEDRSSVASVAPIRPRPVR
jgi:hypothetical protein